MTSLKLFGQTETLLGTALATFCVLFVAKIKD